MTPIDDETREQIVALEDGLQRALMTADLAWFEENWSPDALYVHLSGGVDDRSEFIERLRSKATVYNSRETGDLTLRRFGDTVIATGWSKIDILVRGAQKVLDTRFTRVYAKEGGRWVLVSNQSGGNSAPPSS